jgi:spermidine/putrescine-binding protein
MQVPSNWKGLIDEATKHEAKLLVNALSKKVEEKEGIKVVSK